MATVERIDEGVAPDGKPAYSWLLKTKSAEAQILSWGATLTKLKTPDRNGKLGHVVLGFEKAQSYFKPHPYMGSTIGRFANRIKDGRISIDGTSIQLSQNDSKNHLHGGSEGFHNCSWNGEYSVSDQEATVILTHKSPDGSQGYPGDLNSTIIYSLHEDGALTISFHSNTNKSTVVSMTNHSYFNLSDGSEDHIRDHQLKLHCQLYTPSDKQGIPTGETQKTNGSHLDFSTLRPFPKPDSKLLQYDNNMIIDGEFGSLRPAARITHPKSGRCIDIETSKPCLQLYTGQYINPSLKGHHQEELKPNHGFCIEAQHVPNAPNQQKLPDAILRPGEQYQETVRLSFSLI